MTAGGLNFEKIIVAVIAIFVLFYVALSILAAVAIKFGFLLIVISIVGGVVAFSLHDDQLMLYSLGVLVFGMLLVIGGNTCLSFFKHDPIGFNYSQAVNSVFLWMGNVSNNAYTIPVMGALRKSSR
jgi:hypothetical protein